MFKPFYRFDTGCASDLLGCGSLGQCAVVDPLEPLCGAGMSGKPSSTLAFERRCNPLLTATREEFIAEVAGTLPPLRPASMAATVPANRGHDVG